MSFESERRSIYTFVLNNWSQGSFGPIFPENQKYDEPKDSPYSLLSIVPVTSLQESIAGDNNLFRHEGICQIDYLISEDKGTATAKNLMDYVNPWMRNANMRTDDGEFIQFRVPYLRNLGNQNGRYRFVISCDFYRHEYADNPLPQVLSP